MYYLQEEPANDIQPAPTTAKQLSTPVINESPGKLPQSMPCEEAETDLAAPLHEAEALQEDEQQRAGALLHTPKAAVKAVKVKGKKQMLSEGGLKKKSKLQRQLLSA